MFIVEFYSKLLKKEVRKEFSTYKAAKEFAIKVDGIIIPQ